MCVGGGGGGGGVLIRDNGEIVRPKEVLRVLHVSG